MVKTLVLDAGHGGYDGGAEGNGLKEKDLTLAIALETERILSRDYMGVRVIQTRRTDKYLSLKQRSDISNSYKTDLFASIHINSAGNIAANGYESYISPYTAHKPTMRSVHNEIANYFKMNNIRDRGLKEVAFYVLRWTHAPAILTESLFINNPTEARFINNNIKGIAAAHARAFAKVLNLPKKVTQSTDKGGDDKVVKELKKEVESLKKEVTSLRKLVGNGKAGASLAPTVKRAVEGGITDGSRMGEPAKREEVVAMIVRTLDKNK